MSVNLTITFKLWLAKKYMKYVLLVPTILIGKMKENLFEEMKCCLLHSGFGGTLEACRKYLEASRGNRLVGKDKKLNIGAMIVKGNL